MARKLGSLITWFGVRCSVRLHCLYVCGRSCVCVWRLWEFGWKIWWEAPSFLQTKGLISHLLLVCRRKELEGGTGHATPGRKKRKSKVCFRFRYVFHPFPNGILTPSTRHLLIKTILTNKPKVFAQTREWAKSATIMEYIPQMSTL